jgi:hypothetical protein
MGLFVSDRVQGAVKHSKNIFDCPDEVAPGFSGTAPEPVEFD